jgi:hypothetical protein
MSSVKVEHNKNKPYAQLSKKTIWDTNLSLQAIGLWARCISRPSDWVIRTSELARSCGLNIKTIRKIIEELEKNNYILKVERRDKSTGKPLFDGVEYTIFEEQQTDEELKQRLSDIQKSFTKTTFWAPMKQTLLNNEGILKNKDIKKESSSSPSKLSFKDSSKKELKKKISFEDKEFEEAWIKYEAQEKGKVGNVIGWLKKVIETDRNDKGKETKEQRIERHKKQAKGNEGDIGLSRIVSGRTYVEFINGMKSLVVNYDVKEEEWVNKTNKYFKK